MYANVIYGTNKRRFLGVFNSIPPASGSGNHSNLVYDCTQLTMFVLGILCANGVGPYVI